jgi:tetratricopeptide (TPR) repeat protein
MSKPMAVTLPVVLLILDVYPLGRTGVRELVGSQWRVVVEKVPFFVLSIVSSILTVRAQGTGGSIVPVWVHPLGDRVLIAFKGLCYYLLKTIWPSGLVPLYPFPIQISLEIEYIVSFFIVISLTTLSLWLWFQKKRIFLIVWFSYIVMLSPVLGIVQTGGHAVANRYTYLPLLGPFLLLWLGVESVWTKANKAWPGMAHMRIVFFSLLLALILVFSFLTIRQGLVWKDSLSLWNEEILHFPSIHIAYDSRADAYVKKGDFPKAIEDLKRSLAINSRYPVTYFRLGLVYERTGTYIQAMQNHGKSLELFPGFEPARQGRERAYQNALKELNRDIHDDTRNVVLYMNRGNIHALMEHYGKALQDFNRAVQLNPGIPTVYYNRGLVFFNMKQYDRAIDDFNVFLEHNPEDSQTFYHRAMAFEREKDMQQAIRDFKNAARLGDERSQGYLQSQGIEW